jgi:hypothetical protein
VIVKLRALRPVEVVLVQTLEDLLRELPTDDPQKIRYKQIVKTRIEPHFIRSMRGMKGAVLAVLSVINLLLAVLFALPDLKLPFGLSAIFLITGSLGLYAAIRARDITNQWYGILFGKRGIGTSEEDEKEII